MKYNFKDTWELMFECPDCGENLSRYTFCPKCQINVIDVSAHPRNKERVDKVIDVMKKLPKYSNTDGQAVFMNAVEFKGWYDDVRALLGLSASK